MRLKDKCNSSTEKMPKISAMKKRKRLHENGGITLTPTMGELCNIDHYRGKSGSSWTNIVRIQPESSPVGVETDCKCPDKALLLQSQVLALSPPSTRALKAFRRWFFFKDLPVLWGLDKNLFTDEQDLVALAPTETDRLDAFLQNYLGWFFRVSIQSSLDHESDSVQG